MEMPCSKKKSVPTSARRRGHCSPLKYTGLTTQRQTAEDSNFQLTIAYYSLLSIKNYSKNLKIPLARIKKEGIFVTNVLISKRHILNHIQDSITE